MKLLTKEIEKRFATIGRQEGNDNPLVIVKFFNPCGAQTWYATEYDSQRKEFFGYVKTIPNDLSEWGYFSLTELEEIRLPFGLKIERDLYFNEQPIKNLIK